ncbi:MAG: winged helix-turn-helix transcriptional regulator [Acidobacteria bacterium]|nr:winged helix-turn-helix transcriptional regulator [Acidobacteriota bacterium]
MPKPRLLRTIESEFYEPSPLLRELQVLSILANNPEASQKEIALEVGLAPSMIHNYIHALAEAGLVEFHGPTRRRLRYVVTDSGRARIDSLAARHLTAAGSILERVTVLVRREIERVVRDGVKSLGVIAAPDLAGTLSRMAAESGLTTRALGHSQTLAGLDAVFIAVDPTSGEGAAAVRRCREQGLPVYCVA